MKTKIQLLPLEDLEDCYFLANTSSFIVCRFRNLPAVKDYAEKYEAAMIAEDAMTIASTWKLSSKTLALFYGLLVALSFKNYAEAFPLIKQFSNIRYDFMPDLLNGLFELMTPLTISNVALHSFESISDDFVSCSSVLSISLNASLPQKGN